MYNSTQSSDYKSLTQKFLGSNNINETNVTDLRNALRFLEHSYYINAVQIITDQEYDLLFKKLQEWESNNPDNIPADSPTQRIATALSKEFPKKEHLVPMLSLSNSYNADDLRDWDKRNKESSGMEVIEYCAEPKFDGASLSLVYENDQLLTATTRGDGIVGDEITTNAKRIKSIPLSANFAKWNIAIAEIRGEVMMNKKNFAAYNKLQEEEGLSLLANPRNAAAGSLRMKDSAAVGRRNLEAFIYNVSYEREGDNTAKEQRKLTHHGTMEMLQQIGFKTPIKEMKLLNGIESVIKFINEFETKRDELPYEIDGMVIKVNDLQLQDKLGMTSHHPRWAMAYKYKARQAESVMLDVEYQVGRTGAVTPVAKIQPTQVGGVTASSISIHNEDYIKEKDLRLGDHIIIERSGDVIPQIVRSVAEKRNGKETEIVFPKNCPVCSHDLHRPEGEAVWRCININCEAQVLERIIHFVSKDAMDIKSFGEANVRKFYAMGIVTNIPSIYGLKVEDFAGTEGFGEKSITNLLMAIEQSKQQPLHRLIYALGIRYVGETTAKTLAQEVKDIFELANFSEERLLGIDDVGVKVAASIREFFDDETNVALLQELKNIGVQTTKLESAVVEGEQRFTGKTFLFTGTLSQLKRSDAEAAVEAEGAKILSGVSSKLSYLVVGTDAGSKLEKAKKLTGISILSEEEFMEMMRGKKEDFDYCRNKA